MKSAAIEVRDPGLPTMQKVSRRLIPYLFVLYVAAYLDRINIGFAQLQMKSALGFSDTVYGLGAGIFFLGYFLFEVPSNLILARVGARVWIARIMITWGLIASAMAIVRTPAEFYALRFLLGVAEAGFFPGVIYYLSQWFPAAARASAISRFMTAAAVSGIVGGPLSAALFKLDGVSGLAGWQWIFVAEGIPSVVLGVTTLWFLTDRPAEAKWLSPADREHLERTMRSEAADIARRGHVSLRDALLHPTVWRLSLLSFTLLVGLYGISFWLPQIVESLSSGDNVEVALLSGIPYVAAAVAMVVVGAHSDRNRERCLHIAGAALVGAAGLGATAMIQTPVPA
jgi:ACS family tartrate transporter-like MFS transporter